MLDQGLINESEFKKAISLIDSNKKNNFDDIEVKQITGIVGTEKFEKYEFYIDNYRVHTLGPGVIRVDNLLTGETDVSMSDNFKVKFSKEGKRNDLVKKLRLKSIKNY